MNIFKTDYD